MVNVGARGGRECGRVSRVCVAVEAHMRICALVGSKKALPQGAHIQRVGENLLAALQQRVPLFLAITNNCGAVGLGSFSFSRR